LNENGNIFQVRVFCVQFSPTGQSFSVATTEGLMQYSLNTGGVFLPFELQLNVTPQSVRESLHSQEWCTALMYSLQLNENKIIQEVIETIPYSDGMFVFVVIINSPVNFDF